MTHHRDDDLPDDALDRRLDAVLRDLRGSYNVPPAPPLAAMWGNIEDTLGAEVVPLVPLVPLALHRPRAVSPWPRRVAQLGALAATLLAGVAIGRMTARPESAAVVAEATDPKKPKVAPKGLERARPVVVEARPELARGREAAARRDASPLAPPASRLTLAAGTPAERPAPMPAPRAASGAAGDSTTDAVVATSSSTRYLGQATALLIALSTEAPRPGEDARLSRRAGSLLVTTRLLLDAPTTDAATRELLEDLELVLTQVVRLQTAAGREELQLIREALEQRDLLPRLHTAAMNGAED